MLLWMIAWACAGTLQLSDVLDSVDGRVPKIAEAEAKAQASEAKVLSARGAFDPKLKGKGSVYWSKDPRQIVDVAVGGDSTLGLDWSVGYRYGDGSFPPYAEDYKTGERGEFVARLEMPLLDGLLQGVDRVELDRARLSADVARADLMQTELAIRFRAAKSYWSWVKEGAKLRVDEDLLRLAESRAVALRREVEEGLRAEMHLLDNERVLLERRGAVESARASVMEAGFGLSLYYRDSEGVPRVPGLDALPDVVGLSTAEVSLESDLEEVEQRPDLTVLRTLQASNEVAMRGARNRLLPDVSVSVEHAQPFTDDPAETILGINVGSSLALRKERGTLEATKATGRSLDARLQMATDQARADVQGTHARLDAARRQATLLADAMDRADRVRTMETRRFELGASDLLAVLLREESLAKARKLWVDASYATRMLEAELDVLVGRTR